MSVVLRRKKLKNGDHSLYLDIYHNGKRHYEFLSLQLTEDKKSNRETLALAESIRSKRIVELFNDEHGFMNKFKQKANFVEYFEKLVNDRPADRPTWHNMLLKLKTFTNGTVRFDEIDADWLKGLQRFLLDEVSDVTAFHYYANLKCALGQAVKDKIILHNPCLSVKSLKKPEVKKEYLELFEIETLAATRCPNNEVKRAFLFSCFTGLRLSDITNLKYGNIKRERIEFRQRKTKHLQYLPLSQTALKILYDNIETGIIPHPEKNVFKLPVKSNISLNIQKWLAKAGIKKRITFHSARHTFATLSLTFGADLYTVSKLLGHKNIETTQVYAKIIDEKQKKAMDLLPNLEIS